MTMPSYWKHCLVEEAEPEMNLIYRMTLSRFFERYGIEMFTIGGLHCACGTDLKQFDYRGRCPVCHRTCDDLSKPYYSEAPCACCGETEPGNRVNAVGLNIASQELQEFSICTACEYYNEHADNVDVC